MLNSTHPDDARLSALASRESDALADAALAEHAASCSRCSSLVEELVALRANLAALPDLAPNRPLQLLPEVTAGADRLGLWVRRVFAPVMAAGTALALVGMVGTAAPAFSGVAGGSAATASGNEAALQAASNPPAGALEYFGSGAPTRDNANEPAAGGPAGESVDRSTDGYAEDDNGSATLASQAERSPWPMVLFAGVALLVAAALLRWIVVPRAG